MADATSSAASRSHRSHSGSRFLSGGLIDGRSFEVAQFVGFSSQTTVSCYALRIDQGQIEITIHGASRFDLSFYHPHSQIVVNNRRYDLAPGSLGVSFECEDEDWKILAQD